MNPANIYIDAFGSAHLDSSNDERFSHFIYTAVIINQSDVEKATSVVEETCNKFGLGKKLISANISDEHFSTRLHVLSDLVQQLDFTVDVLVIDKARIDSEGLKQKRIFHKYFQSLFVSKYNERFDTFFIYANTLEDDFRKELQLYVDTKSIQRDLFNPNRSFQLIDHLADDLSIENFVGGCMGKIFCISHAHEQARDLYNLLHSRTSVDYFPFETINNFGATAQTHEVDAQIRMINLQSIEKHLEKQTSISSNEQVLILNYLRFQSDINPYRLVPTQEILAYLQNYFPSYTTEKLRILIRDLRYDGLLIVSQAGRPGYKLATSYEDVYEHFNHFLKYVIPMLQKVQILNQTISSHSLNTINPVEKDGKMILLKELLSSLSK